MTIKQDVFIAEYLSCFNATEAARRAGYAHPNMAGPRLIVNDSIKERIDAMLQEKMMTADEALVRMAEIARGEWSQYITETGHVDIAQMVDDGNAHLIKSITPTNNGRKYEFWDMQSALNTVLKHHGELIDRHDHTTNGESINATNELRDKILARISARVAEDDSEPTI